MTEPVPPGGVATAPAPRRRGVAGSAADMVRSLGVLFVAIAVVWFASGMWHNSTRGVTAISDWQSQVTEVAPGAPFALEVPSSLPAGWTVTVLRRTGGGPAADWTMTVTTAGGRYLDLDQAAGSIGARTAAQLPGATAAGSVLIAGNAWARFALTPDERGAPRAALARVVGATAVLISGTGTVAEQQQFAGSLHAVS